MEAASLDVVIRVLSFVIRDAVWPYEAALRGLEASRRNADVRAAKRVRECVAREQQLFVRVLRFFNCIRQVSAASPPSPQDVDAYNDAADELRRIRWSIETKSELLKDAKDGIRHDGWVLCDYCLRLVPQAEALGEYCSKSCRKGASNRREWQLRRAHSGRAAAVK